MEVHEVTQQLIVIPRLMITIFWGVSGIHVIHYLSPGRSFDSMYFIDHILDGFKTFPIIRVADKQKKRL
jgi:hypothetical protein